VSSLHHQVPPAGEDVHVPGPSLLPVFNAAGAGLALLGLAAGLVLTVIGGVIFLVTLVRWITLARRELDQLPLRHE